MKTSQALVIIAIVAASLALSQAAPGEGFDAWKDAEDESQSDVFSNRIQERREQLRSMWDPSCVVWSRRANGNCFLRKRSYRSRKVIFCVFYLNILSDVMQKGSPRKISKQKQHCNRMTQCPVYQFSV